MMALSCDSVEDHLGWSKDVEHFNANQGREKKELSYPIIADPDRKLAVKFGMLDPDEIDAKVRQSINQELVLDPDEIDAKVSEIMSLKSVLDSYKIDGKVSN